MDKKSNRGYRRSDKLIKDAVITLLGKKKDFFSISVSDLCEEAGLNRGTFYNHYANIGEVASAIEDDMMKELASAWVDSKGKDSTINNFIKTVTMKLKEREIAYRQIVNYVPEYFFRDMKEKFLNEIENYFKDKERLSNYGKTTIAVLASGIVSLYLDYFEGHNSMSLDEIGEYSYLIVVKLLSPSQETPLLENADKSVVQLEKDREIGYQYIENKSGK
ncbi:MAG: TetR/AcrR family transcriptional regulator [Bacilli bacterium]|jgi:AcrR family transcriptional regulator|nr:TetR/AcrR family transcriptional regulator [Bacilli bacterium]MCI2055379.1 TetR/AcrR family transcriptional regulator [Bacilli bacterium]